MTYLESGCIRCGKGIPHRREGSPFCSARCEKVQLLEDEASAAAERAEQARREEARAHAEADVLVLAERIYSDANRQPYGAWCQVSASLIGSLGQALEEMRGYGASAMPHAYAVAPPTTERT